MRPIIISLTAALILLSPTSAVASERDATAGARLRDNSQLCQRLQQRLDQTVANYNTRRDLHLGVYRRLLTRFSNLLPRLQSQGADTNQLQADLTNFASQLNSLDSDYATFTATLAQVNTQSCDLDRAQLKNRLRNARQQLQTFRNRSRQLHNFIKNTLRADLLTLRRQVRPTNSPTP